MFRTMKNGDSIEKFWAIAWGKNLIACALDAYDFKREWEGKVWVGGGKITEDWTYVVEPVKWQDNQE